MNLAKQHEEGGLPLNVLLVLHEADKHVAILEEVVHERVATNGGALGHKVVTPLLVRKQQR